MTPPPDLTPPEDRPTVRPPAAPGTPPCQYLGCGSGLTQFPCVPGTDRCERHLHTSPTVRMHAVVLEAFREATR